MSIRLVPRDFGGGAGTGFQTLSLSRPFLWHLQQLSPRPPPSPWVTEHMLILVLTDPSLFFKTLSAGARQGSWEAGAGCNWDASLFSLGREGPIWTISGDPGPSLWQREPQEDCWGVGWSLTLF